MTCLKDVTKYVRSKNAGPFWITVDVFFTGAETFDEFAGVPALSVNSIARAFDTPLDTVKRFEVPSLHMIKFSFPRKSAQGGVVERDMHGGQMFVRLLDMELFGNMGVLAGQT